MSNQCLYLVTKYATKLCSFCNANFEALLFFVKLQFIRYLKGIIMFYFLLIFMRFRVFSLQHRSDGQYFSFVPVTYVPYEPKLINVKMLSPQHVSYICICIVSVFVFVFVFIYFIQINPYRLIQPLDVKQTQNLLYTSYNI
jgi:hypothetical protein